MYGVRGGDGMGGVYGVREGDGMGACTVYGKGTG